MSTHSYVKNYLHVIWCTYERQRLLYTDLRLLLFDHLKMKLSEIGVNSERINIQPEHVHLLIELPSDKCIADVVRQLKGESSNWINDNNLIRDKFRWSRGFAAFSISASQLDRVKHYISNQEEHHRSRSFIDEYMEFVEKYGFTYDDK